MARYKHIDTSPRFLPVDLAQQLLPGTFEHAAYHLLHGPVDLSRFDARFRNDDTGAPAYPPAMLLTVVLCAYAHGIVSSRAIERLCREHVTFIALCGETAPHFTTIAQFVSTLGPDIAHVFAAVLAICDQQGLIGREMFAIDGVKLPSNACESGTAAPARTSSGRRPSVKPLPPRCSPGTAQQTPNPSSRTWPRRTRRDGNGSSTTRKNSGPGSPRTPRTGVGPRAACGRATGPTPTVRSWPRARA